MPPDSAAVPVIETAGLTKRYGQEVLAVDRVDLAIRADVVYALLGPNGAGKTTLISMLTTLVAPTAGSAKVRGFDVVQQADQVRRRIGVTFQEMILDEELTGRQVLDYHGRLYGQPRAKRRERSAELLALVELEQAADRRCSTYSGGMKRRLELARGLMTEPEVLFLDEPTLGLDPQNRAGIWQYVRDLKRRLGTTLLFTTHYMEEAQEMADRVGIIDHGRIVVEAEPQTLIEQMGEDRIRIAGDGDNRRFAERLRELPYVQAVTEGSGLLQIGVDSGSRRLAEAVTLAAGCGFRIDEVSVAKPSLGDVFLEYTGRELRDK